MRHTGMRLILIVSLISLWGCGSPDVLDDGSAVPDTGQKALTGLHGIRRIRVRDEYLKGYIGSKLPQLDTNGSDEDPELIIKSLPAGMVGGHPAISGKMSYHHWYTLQQKMIVNGRRVTVVLASSKRDDPLTIRPTNPLSGRDSMPRDVFVRDWLAANN